ncbi:MAG TPA: type VI secretion system baseplate subunit TssK [Paucimonas sp.]|nr:type VI secretion system baseplate subunit TssK [Paucimonas sp.]
MNDFANLPDAVQWSEGMLLSPQHLQQNDIYWHRHLGHRLACVTPHYWGLRALKLKTAQPVDGVVAIAELECVLPDGTLVQFPGNYDQDKVSLLAKVGDICKNPGDKASIWLVVNERGDQAASGRNPKRRYDSLALVETADENTGDNKVPVGRIQVRIELKATAIGEQAPQTCFPYPLLQVEADAQNHLRFSSYHPPMLQLGAVSFHDGGSLLQQCRKYVDALQSKTRQLAGERSDDKPDQDAAALADNERHLAVARGLASVLPTLWIASDSEATHPSRMYEAFALAVGQVAGIGSNPIPLRMGPYNHSDCMPQFEAVFNYIDSKLALVDAEYDFLPFGRIAERDGFAGFARRVPADAKDELLVELRRGEDQSAEALGDWIKSLCIIADNMREDAKTRRMLGAERTLLSSQELKERGLRPTASVLRIANMKIEVTDKGMQDVIQPGQSILLLSPADQALPALASLIWKRAPKGGLGGANGANGAAGRPNGKEGNHASP